MANQSVASQSVTGQIGNKPDEDATHYIKQHYRNTLSRLDGWKRTGQQRATIVSTKVKAAAVKGENIRPPINVWNLLLAGGTALCLASCFYVMFAAFMSMKLPYPVMQAPHQEYVSKKDTLSRNQVHAKSALANNAKRNQLSATYFNLAQLCFTKNQFEQALFYLKKIDPQSTYAQQGLKLKDKIAKASKQSQ